MFKRFLDSMCQSLSGRSARKPILTRRFVPAIEGLETRLMPAFFAPIASEAGNSPGDVFKGDFNRDGKMDIAVVSPTTDQIQILLGLGNGKFKAPVSYAVGDQPVGIAAGDFNGDKKLDLVVSNTGSDDASVLLGNGAGTFKPAVNYTLGDGPQNVVVKDLNNDKKLDFATPNYFDATFTIRLGIGDGTFGSAKTYVAGTNPAHLAADDLNGDGKVDVVILGTLNDEVLVRLGNGVNGSGTPSFQVGQAFAAGDGPFSVAIADLNGDKKKDLAVLNAFSGDVSILLGDNTASLPHPSTTLSAGRLPTSSSATSMAMLNSICSLPTRQRTKFSS
ncbi:MAG: VCBS repeat-containing protein [Planctomycetes bacterium]|nr:VCBS repeat-containing protein [Planctomycetota bacterium]